MQYDLSAHEVPDWARCEGKLSGYRLGGTYADCLASLLRCHNSTIDAWTMIVASCISTALALYILHKRANPVPVVAVWLSALIHMPWSVGYHTFAPISNDVCTRWMKLDIAFIFVSGALLAFGLAYNVLPPWGVAVNTLVAVAVAAFAIHAIRRAKTKASDNKVKTTMFIGSIVLAYMFPMLYYVARGGRGLPVACAITAL